MEIQLHSLLISALDTDNWSAFNPDHLMSVSNDPDSHQ